MNGLFVTCGGINIDNIVTANRKLFLNQVGGNAIYSAISSSLWSDHVRVVGNIPSNFPLDWLEPLTEANIDVGSVVKKPCSVDVYEWFIYSDDGSRMDRLFLPPNHAISWLGDKMEGEILELHEHEALLAMVEPSDKASGETFASFRQRYPISVSQLTFSMDSVQGCHLAPSALEVHEELVSYLRPKNSIITLDPGPYVQTIESRRLVGLLNAIDVFMPSEKELLWLFPKLTLLEGMAKIAEMASCSIVVKCGTKGSLLWDEGRKLLYEIKAYPAETVDPTGAGDTYCGSFMVNLAMTGDPLLAATRASAAASCVVKAPSIRGIQKTRMDDILARTRSVSSRIIRRGQVL